MLVQPSGAGLAGVDLVCVRHDCGVLFVHEHAIHLRPMNGAPHHCMMVAARGEWPFHQGLIDIGHGTPDMVAWLPPLRWRRGLFKGPTTHYVVGRAKTRRMHRGLVEMGRSLWANPSTAHAFLPAAGRCPSGSTIQMGQPGTRPQQYARHIATPCARESKAYREPEGAYERLREPT